MQSGLSVKFNHKAPAKEIKTESDIKVGARRKADGGTMYVRAGKIVSESESPVTQKILAEMRQAAVEYCSRITEDARVAQIRMRPAGIVVHAKPGM